MTSSAKRDEEFDLEVFLTRHRRTITTAAAVVVAGGAGFWFWTASAERKAERSEQAYLAAQNAYFSGNQQLAQSELQRVLQRYGGTNAGVRAAILVARSYYDDSKHAEGVTALQTVLGSGAAKPFRPAINSMIAIGLEAQGKFAEAAAAHRAAAQAEPLEAQRDQHEANAARALASGGDKAGAAAIWERLAARDASPMVVEAKLRVAELKATTAR